jgi:small-conductance mechanosensitive channel
MDVQQDINLRIFGEFRKRGIEFAYPTQTLYLNKV